MLREAGDRGIRSDTFYREFMGRGAARIKDLRDAGHNIVSEREGKYVRYRLVGVGADQGVKAQRRSLLETPAVEVCTDSGEPRGVTQPDRTFPLSGSAPPCASRELALFPPPPMSAFTDSEAA
jgi:hypothetical protein